MLYTVGIICIILAQTASAQLGFGGGGYCATCAMKNQRVNSPGFGFGGGSNNFGIPASSPIQTTFGSAVTGNNGYGLTNTQSSTSTIFNPSSNTYASQFTIPTSICPTGKCNCNSGICTTCNTCGWNKIPCTCANGVGNCCNRQQFNSYDFKPWTSPDMNGFRTASFNTANNILNSVPVIQAFTMQPSISTDNSLTYGFNQNAVNYKTFSQLPKSNFESFNQFGNVNNQYETANNLFGNPNTYNIPGFLVSNNKV